MPYSSSLTRAVQDTMNQSILKKIADINQRMFDLDTCDAIRAFLSDPTTINTPSFVLRRYLQTKYPELLTDSNGRQLCPGEDYNDLTKSGNIPWEKDGSSWIVDQVARALEQLCPGDQYTPAIARQAWKGYLTNGKPQRSRILLVAMALQMDVDTTKEYFLACGENPYSARNPQELICYYCQHWPDAYRWADVQRLLKDFIDKAKKAAPSAGDTAQNASPASDIRPGQTQQFNRQVEQLWKSTAPIADRNKELLNFMVENRDQFVSCTLNDRGRPVISQSYSLTNRFYYMRLLQYLAVLYPEVQKDMILAADLRDLREQQNQQRIQITEDRIVNHRLYKIGALKEREPNLPANQFNEDDITHPFGLSPVSVLDNGLPCFADLLNAMYQSADWDFSAWHAETQQSGDAPESLTFNLDDYRFCQNYYDTGSGILRGPRTNRTYTAVSRRDVLLLGYFFLRELYNASDEKRKSLTQLASGKNLFAEPGLSLVQLAELVKPLDAVVDQALQYIQCNTPWTDAVHLILDKMLCCFDFLPLYAPSPFDRFVYLSLLDESLEMTLPQMLLCGLANR